MPRNTLARDSFPPRAGSASMRPRRNAAEYILERLLSVDSFHASMRPRRNAAEYFEYIGFTFLYRIASMRPRRNAAEYRIAQQNILANTALQ